ncbi:MAG TPA: ELWxxDGT repeat protein [Candidatus Limnocylindrales bacterium]|nr:ELWxxDGT repeat protein [Candidatus Limnocylindrales bacterium]
MAPLSRSASMRIASALVLGLTVVGGNAGAVAGASGPYLVKDILPSGGSIPRELTDVNGTLFFTAKDESSGRELWTTDGTPEGTQRIKDIRPGSAGSTPLRLEAVGDRLYFSADDGATGRELWISDGTELGTKRVKDIRPGAPAGDPRGFTPYNDNVYFSADDGVTGIELWRTDGTPTGTRRVKDIRTGPDSSYPGAFVEFAGKLYFIRSGATYSERVLYKTDGTAKGTKAVRGSSGAPVRGAIGDEESGDPDAGPGLTVAGANLYFCLDELELWRSTGTAAGTKKLADLGTFKITSAGGHAFLHQRHYWSGETGHLFPDELWKSDGTKAGTTMIASTAAENPVDVDGTLFFFSEGGIWTSDGTSAGTQPVGVDVRASVGAYGYARSLAVLDSVLYFNGFLDGEGAERLWRSDGTFDGTHVVSATPSSQALSNITGAGDTIFFTATAGGHGNELWAFVP